MAFGAVKAYFSNKFNAAFFGEKEKAGLCKYIGAIDQGTTSTRFIVFEANTPFRMVASHQLPHTQFSPRPGWLEHDPLELLSNTYECIRKVLGDPKNAHIAPLLISIGVTNQRETTLVWDRVSGKPLYNAIVWSDSRTAEICKRYSAHQDFVRETTGLRISPYFSATKLVWLMENVPGLRAKLESGEAVFGTVETFLLAHLLRPDNDFEVHRTRSLLPLSSTALANLNDQLNEFPEASAAAAAAAAENIAPFGEDTLGQTKLIHVSDITNASRTMLVNIHTGDWDPRLLKMFGIPRAALATIVSNSEIYGYLDLSRLSMGGTGFGHAFCGPSALQIPISGALGDQNAALLGQGCLSPCQGKVTYGTGAFLLFNTGKTPVLSQGGLLTSPAFSFKRSLPDNLTSMGSVTSSCNASSSPEENEEHNENPVCDHAATCSCAGVDSASTAPLKNNFSATGEIVYAIEGSVAAAGRAIAFMSEILGLSIHEMEKKAQSVGSSGGVYFVPAFSGLLAPHWDEDAQALITGLNTTTRVEHLCRASFEAVALQVSDIFAAFVDDILATGQTPLAKTSALTEPEIFARREEVLSHMVLKVDGGASASDLLLQLQADCLNVPILRPTSIETTCLGAALASALAEGVDHLTYESLFDLYNPDKRPTESKLEQRMAAGNGLIARIFRRNADSETPPDGTSAGMVLSHWNLSLKKACLR